MQGKLILNFFGKYKRIDLNLYLGYRFKTFQWLKFSIYRNLILGSTNGAIRSAMRLPMTMAMAETRVTPMMMGMSTRWIACQAN